MKRETAIDRMIVRKDNYNRDGFSLERPDRRRRSSFGSANPREKTMLRKGIKTYLAGFLVTALLAGSLGVPSAFGAAGYETGNKSSERLNSGTGHTLKDKMRAHQKMRHEDMTADKRTERERERERTIEIQDEAGNG
jgi:hypothetical protein